MGPVFVPRKTGPLIFPSAELSSSTGPIPSAQRRAGVAGFASPLLSARPTPALRSVLRLGGRHGPTASNILPWCGEHRIIQTKFATITTADVAAAKDQRDRSLIFAAVSSTGKQKVASNLNKMMKSFGVNVPELEGATKPRLWLHPKPRHGYARRRRLEDKRTLAHIRGENRAPFRIVFRRTSECIHGPMTKLRIMFTN